MPHLVIMAAGTGGHITPGLAVAGEMQRRGWTVSWMGTTTGLENRLVPPSGIPLDGLAFSGLRGKGFWHAATGGLRLLKAFWDAARVLRRRHADAVLGMGGYICFPGGLMASLLGKPLMLVNADAALLLSNKALLPVADRVAFGFEGGSQGVKQALVTGNPVRAEVAALPPPQQRYAARQGPLRLLVVGGSLGARVLNETVPQALALMAEHQRPRVVHQTGQSHAQAVEQRWADLGLNTPAVSVRPFIDDMAHELAQADVVLCRAGAITVSELCAAGVASILVPLVVSTTAHQRHNAAYMAEQGAALHLEQGQLTPQVLADLLSRLTRETLLGMAERARACARADATTRVADELDRLVKHP
jgi:UDP-N-acetylglucosamine--N-acetylmuramyl-(pentapeptide) pyrophosphoryl-undecaprenol N-acetylglucosamine transferase